jgi:hypothetical protein
MLAGLLLQLWILVLVCVRQQLLISNRGADRADRSLSR